MSANFCVSVLWRFSAVLVKMIPCKMFIGSDVSILLNIIYILQYLKIG